MADHAFVTTPAGTRPPRTARPPAPPAPARPTSPPDDGAVVTLRPWDDPRLAGRGHAVHSRYVERFWLGVLGPTGTWLLRRLDDELAQAPAAASDGVVRVDLVAVARQMGMAYAPGRSSAFARAIQRCVMFGVAHHTADGLAIRRRLPPVSERQLRRLPPAVVADHDRLEATHTTTSQAERAWLLGRAMHEAGDCPDQIETQLVAIGVPARLAEAVDHRLRTGPDRAGPGGPPFSRSAV